MKVKLTITESTCRGGYCKAGDEFFVEDLCPPMCHELWNSIYPYVCVLQNGGELDYGSTRAKVFDAKCPDGGRVCVHGEVIDDQYARIETERMVIEPISNEEIEAWIKMESDPDMQQAYSEMLDGCVKNPEQRLWHTVWNMQLKSENMKRVGDLCFKGLGSDGMVEIGYGMQEGYKGQGYMSEAVQAMVDWCMKQDAVKRIEAETDPDNKASQRILAKAGFTPNGVMGEEGPRFVIEKVMRKKIS